MQGVLAVQPQMDEVIGKLISHPDDFNSKAGFIWLYSTEIEYSLMMYLNSAATGYYEGTSHGLFGSPNRGSR